MLYYKIRRMQQRYKDFQGESYHVWKTVKSARDGGEYTIFQPSFDRGDECSLVFVAKVPNGSYCALKCYPKHWGNSNHQCIATEEAMLKSLRGKCNGVPKVFGEGHFVSDDRKYLVMELANKGSLFNVIRETGPLSEPELKGVLLSVLGTLSLMHKEGILHRNLNPKHILVNTGKEGSVEFKLCDFKYATNINEKKPKEWIGTPAYMAPEISEKEDKEYTAAVDIWSLGITCYHLLTGRTPQSVDNDLLRTLAKGQKIKYSRIIMKSLSPEAVEFIAACLILDPAKRPSAEELLHQPFLTTAKLQTSPALATMLEEETEQLAQLFCKLWADNIKGMPLAIRTSIEPYEDIKILGNGQFGQIRHLKDKKTGVQYVAKVLRRAKLMDENSINTMIQEIRILQELDKCPYVTDIHDAFTYKGDFYLVLEYCNGGDLEAYIQNLAGELPLPIKEFKQIAWNVASGLKELHEHGRVHGELKPRNVLIVKDESNRLVDVKLCDLGFTQEVEKLCGGQTIAGTINFYSPEMWAQMAASPRGSHKSTPRDDVYSLGALLFFVATGKSHKKGTAIDFGEGSKKLPTEVKELITSCMAMRAGDRPTLAGVLRHKLFDMRIDVPVRSSVLPYIYADCVMKEGKLGVTMYECKRLGSDKELAVKIIDMKGRLSKDYLKRFNKEIDVLLKVNMIPTVVKIHDAFFCKETLNIVMDYCNGGDLETYVLSQAKLNKPIPMEEKQFIAYCVLHGIHSIHEMHQIHKDLSPRNILLERDLKTEKLVRARIGDFGVNRILLEGPIEATNRTINTCYMAPELAKGVINYSGDVWSFGMILYFIYFGKHAHEQYSLKEIAEGKMVSEIAAASPGKAGVPANCVTLLSKCIAINPAERPSTGDVLSHTVFHPFEGIFAHL